MYMLKYRVPDAIILTPYKTCNLHVQYFTLNYSYNIKVISGDS